MKDEARDSLLGLTAILASWALAVGLIAILGVSANRGISCVTVGSRGEALSLDYQVDGKVVPLSDLRGGIVVVEVATASCAPCRELIPRLAALQAAYREDVTVVGLIVNLQNSGALERFRTTYPEINYTVALFPPIRADHPDATVVHRPLGHGMALPTLLLIDRDGRLAGRYVGESSFPRLEIDIERLLTE